MSKNNIAYLRRRRNFSQKRLADMIGIPPSTLNRIESGETEGFEKYRALLAKALGCNPESLDEPDFQLPSVLVTGTVKYKTFIKDVPKNEAEHVETIPGLPATTEALEIKTSDLANYHGINDILYFDSIPQKNERLFLGRECVVQLDTKKRGEKLLAWIIKASGDGNFIINAHGSPAITDVKILAAHPILHIKRA